ncbi:Kinesin- protein 12, partial [Borealophlyctis nickersoniae]
MGLPDPGSVVNLSSGDWEVSAPEADEGAKGRVKVVIRVRPMNGTERERGNAERQTVACLEDGRTVQLNSPDGTSRTLTFDRILPPTATQDQVFAECGVRDLIGRAMEGYAATIFAFGQTGSGKTFTITGPAEGGGPPEFNGLVPRAIEVLFAMAMAGGEGVTKVRAAYLEIYNEQVHDLLNPTSVPLAIRWTADKGFFVENLHIVDCHSPADCFAVLEEGIRNRTTRSHKLNEHSSRSHSIMTLFLESPAMQHGTVVKKQGKISFVDLAGSERVKESKTSGESLAETSNINKSLLTL